MSNFTDFDVFDHMEDVNLRYASTAAGIGKPHMLILPGSKNTIADLGYIRSEGIDEVIHSLRQSGVIIAGICGGYQMMGSSISDPHSVEGDAASCRGLNLTSMETVLEKDKITTQVCGIIASDTGIVKGLKGAAIKGYEIHMGRSTHPGGLSFFTETENGEGGTVSDNFFGTYIHGIFDSIEFTGGLLNNIRSRMGLEAESYNSDYAEMREKEFAKLALLVRENVDIKKIYGILDRDDSCC